MRCFAFTLLVGVAAPAVACSAPAPAATSVSVVSDAQLLEADLRFIGPVRRGDNELVVQLRPRGEAGVARLLSVDATMAAHAHVAHAQTITEDAAGFHVAGLDLFMTGRWQLELSLALADRSDSASTPVDVP